MSTDLLQVAAGLSGLVALPALFALQKQNEILIYTQILLTASFFAVSPMHPSLPPVFFFANIGPFFVLLSRKKELKTCPYLLQVGTGAFMFLYAYQMYREAPIYYALLISSCLHALADIQSLVLLNSTSKSPGLFTLFFTSNKKDI